MQAYLKKYWNRSGALRHRFNLVPVEVLEQKTEVTPRKEPAYRRDPSTGEIVETITEHRIDYYLIREGKKTKWVRGCELQFS